MHYNPLVKFMPEMIPGFAAKKVRYLVAQQYYRGKLPNSEKLPLLLTDYPTLDGAKKHLNSVMGDKWAAIIDMENPKHRTKLEEMCQPYSEYGLYAAFTDKGINKELRNNRRLINAAKTYIDNQTNWRPANNTTVNATLELRFGELFVTFKHGQQQRQERLAVLETTRPCATTFHLPATYESYRIIFQDSPLIRR